MTEQFNFNELFKPLDVVDGWGNLVTGLGIAGRDKAESMRYHGRKPLSFTELDELYSYDGMSAKIVDDIVEDGFRCGWKLKFSANGQAVDPEKANELNSRVKDWHKTSGALVHAERQKKFTRAYGGSLLITGADDGGEPWEPLNESRIKSFKWLKPVDRHMVSNGHQIDGDPTSRNYGLPVHYTLTSIQPLSTEGGDSWNATSLKVHSSRVWRSDGVWLSERMRQMNDGWGQSVIERAYDPLRHWNRMNKSVGTLVEDFSQGVYGVKGLVSQLASDKGPLLNRFRTMDMVRSSVNAVLIDADGESFERKTTNVGGLPELMTHGQQWLSAVSGSPMTKLFGLSPGGFGTGESEGENWDDKVGAWQDKVLRPMLEHLYRLLFLTPEFRDVPAEWSIEFAPLQLESPAETADTRLKNAQADNIYMVNAAVSPRDVGESRFGGERYGDDIELSERSDDEGPDDAEAERLNAEALGESAEGEATLSGDQFSSLMKLMEAAKAGTPIESLVEAATFAFPSMDRSKAESILKPLTAEPTQSDEPKPNTPFAPAEPEPESE